MRIGAPPHQIRRNPAVRARLRRGMITCLTTGLVSLAATAVGESAAAPQASARPDPRHVLTTADAIRRVDDVTGRVRRVRDANGDGLDDWILERGGERRWPTHIELVSSKDGATVRELWRAPIDPTPPASTASQEARLAYELARDRSRPSALDSRGDVDHDGVEDLVLGFPDQAPGGRVTIISGRTGSVLVTCVGDRPLDRFGASLAFVGDRDGDGHDDVAVGAPQDADADPSESGSDPRARPTGYVSIRSGHDGHEIMRVLGSRPRAAFGSWVANAGDTDRDGAIDLIVRGDRRALDATRLLSGRTWLDLRSFEHKGGPIGTVGDVDRDGILDVFVDQVDPMGSDRLDRVRILSGFDGTERVSIPYPDPWSPYGVTAGVGDLDGDGVDDLALGEPNFNLRSAGDPGTPAGYVARDPTTLSLKEALKLPSEPWCAFSFEAGAVFVHSGATGRAIVAAWARPGTGDGLGFAVGSAPDLTGDGVQDWYVTDQHSLYVLPAPGRTRDAK